MISSKSIKLLCYIVLGLSLVPSLILVIVGINGLLDKNWFSSIWIALGMLIPLVASVSLYPIFALANIDENVSSLNKKVDSLISKSTRHISVKTTDNNVGDHDKNETKQETDTHQHKQHTVSDKRESKHVIPQDILDFINTKYQTCINSDDDLYTIKSKISNISDNSRSTEILRHKIANSTNLNDVTSAFVLHKYSHNLFNNSR